MSDTQPDPGTSDDHADSAEFADVVLDRLVPVIGEFPRADAGKLGLDHAMLAVLGVLRIVAPLAVASLAGRCALSHAAAARAVGRLVERGYVERITEEGDGRSSWWVGPTALADETLASARAGLRADLTRTATYLTPARPARGAARAADDRGPRVEARPRPAREPVARDAAPTLEGAPP